MRRKIYEGTRERAIDLFRRADVVRLASTTEEGRPVLKTVHGVVVDGHVAFHGAPAGEKIEAVGREAVLGVDEIVAEIPSYFVDPERACPASTYYLSAQTSGPIEEVEDADAKARVLAELMTRFQPQGGYVPIAADHPLYAKAVRGVAILRVSLESAVAKVKLGQNRTDAELRVVLERLWARGRPGDPRAIDLVREANPDAGAPDFLAAPEGVELLVAPDERHAGGAVRLLEETYWNAGEDPERIRQAQLGSTAWVVARDLATGLVAGTARAVSDGARRAWVYDVAVDEAWRGRGVGSALMRVLLEHPRVRGARSVHLSTRDAQAFYREFGFREGGVGAGTAMVKG